MNTLDFNSSHTIDLQASTLIELLQLRALNEPERRGYIFLDDGESEESVWTYAELYRRARAIAALLQQHTAKGERALLFYPPGLEFIAAFFGSLYAGVIAVPVYPPNPGQLERSMLRIQALMESAKPAIVLTTAKILNRIPPLLMHRSDIPRERWLVTDEIAEHWENEWKRPEVDCQTLAFLQYTSGSTGTPKGVMLTHGNLLHNSSLIHRSFQNTSETHGVIWLPPYHDMGLIGGILQPLYGGFPVTLMSPTAFLQRPFRWLQAISKYRATSSGGPNFAYDICVKRISAEQKTALDLSSWRLAFNGAEPIRQETMDRFVAAFEECGFRREAFFTCYGLAEATLIVSGGRKYLSSKLASIVDNGSVAVANPSVSSGQILPDQKIV
ncbi:MAG: fatty acyl-AMP ligase, partial [Acidobacteriota bacterium]